MLKAPPEIRAYYEKHIKGAHQSQLPAREEFAAKVLADDYDFKDPYFKRLQEQQEINMTCLNVRTQKVWMSWRAITEADGRLLVEAQLAQGQIETRPHPNLDPKHPTTEALPKELRLQYQRVEESALFSR